MKHYPPQQTRHYRSYVADSQNWDAYVPRTDDIIVSTSYKSGTTWMQNIVLQLVFKGLQVPPVFAVSPWLDKYTPQLGEVIGLLEGQRHRRVIKTHLPLDAIPYYPQVKYIVVVRDARDVFMSFWNHYSSFNDQVYAAMNDPARLVGPPLPRCPTDIHELWALWINKGWFEWESEGYPHSGNMYHTQSWWDFRDLENIGFFHFNDLLADLPTEIGHVAEFLDIGLTPQERAMISQSTRFAALKQNAANASPMPVAAVAFTWKDGLDTFFFKGTNGRWKDVLTADELRMYEDAKARVLSPDCAAYTEAGRRALK